MTKPEKSSTLDRKPPFFKSWRQIYFLVIANLIVLVFLFYWFTVSYS